MNELILLGRDSEATLQEQHDTALALLPVDRLSLFENAGRVDLMCVPSIENNTIQKRFFLCFSVSGAEEVLVAAYPCDGAGRVLNWKLRVEMWGQNFATTCDRLRFAILNEVVEPWTI
jgi:hypothetical protein